MTRQQLTKKTSYVSVCGSKKTLFYVHKLTGCPAGTEQMFTVHKIYIFCFIYDLLLCIYSTAPYQYLGLLSCSSVPLHSLQVWFTESQKYTFFTYPQLVAVQVVLVICQRFKIFCHRDFCLHANTEIIGVLLYHLFQEILIVTLDRQQSTVSTTILPF